MTLENSKRLYEHYVKNGNTKAAEELSKKRPELSDTPKVEEEVKEAVEEEKPKKKAKK